MEGTDASTNAALQQFQILAKTAKGKAATALVQQALSHPNVFVFGELLDAPNIQKLEEENKPVLDLLKIFAYGTYSEYKATPGLPELTVAQANKLKKLTIVSLSHEKKVITYGELLQQLEIKSLRELEDLIIDCIYQGIIRGRLDQKQQQVEIDFAIGRDLKPGQLDQLISFLSNWYGTSEELLGRISEKINAANQIHQQNKAHKAEFAARVETVKANLTAALHNGADGPQVLGLAPVTSGSSGSSALHPQARKSRKNKYAHEYE